MPEGARAKRRLESPVRLRCDRCDRVLCLMALDGLRLVLVAARRWQTVEVYEDPATGTRTWTFRCRCGLSRRRTEDRLFLTVAPAWHRGVDVRIPDGR